MKTTRRGFLGLLATGAVGACVTLKIPTRYLPQPVQRMAACEFLRQHYNEFVQMHGWPPERIYAGAALYRAYETELPDLHRFTVVHSRTAADPLRMCLLFKATPVYRSGALPSLWSVQMCGGEADWQRYEHAMKAARG